MDSTHHGDTLEIEDMMEAVRGNGYAPDQGMLEMMMMTTNAAVMSITTTAGMLNAETSNAKSKCAT